MRIYIEVCRRGEICELRNNACSIKCREGLAECDKYICTINGNIRERVRKILESVSVIEASEDKSRVLIVGDINAWFVD